MILRRVSDMRSNIAVWARMRVSPCLCRAYIIAERASLSHICTILPTTGDAQLILHWPPSLLSAMLKVKHVPHHQCSITTAEINWTCVPDSVGSTVCTPEAASIDFFYGSTCEPMELPARPRASPLTEPVVKRSWYRIRYLIQYLVYEYICVTWFPMNDGDPSRGFVIMQYPSRPGSTRANKGSGPQVCLTPTEVECSGGQFNPNR